MADTVWFQIGGLFDGFLHQVSLRLCASDPSGRIFEGGYKTLSLSLKANPWVVPIFLLITIGPLDNTCAPNTPPPQWTHKAQKACCKCWIWSDAIFNRIFVSTAKAHLNKHKHFLTRIWKTLENTNDCSKQLRTKSLTKCRKLFS